jgi:hypothetical protein
MAVAPSPKELQNRITRGFVMKRKMLLILGALALPLRIAAPAAAQDPSDMQGMEGMDMEGMDHGMHAMRGMLGSYSMSREASGTAWQPESTPHVGYHAMWNGWDVMTHGFANLVFDHQSGPRGGEKTFSENMLMGMASRDLGDGRLGLRAMVSAEPWTIRAQGYPLLLQTGETANGVTPLVDRQHPHDLLMELAGTYSVPVGAHDSVFLYTGLPGEPALGPATYMHRFSGMDNPEAPLSHHWLDSTHVTFGVATLGWIHDGVKLEGSIFTGREPDQNRTNIESPKMDSWSLRASWQPAPDWSFQVSHGYLHSPEQLEPNVNDRRTTASAMYNRPLPAGNWQTTFAWGRNDRTPGTSTNSFLLESAATRDRHTVFGRVERQQNDELFGDAGAAPAGEASAGDPPVSDIRAGRVFDVGKVSLGYIYDFVHHANLRSGVGLLGSVAFVPGELKSVYGDDPVSGMAFLRVRM